MRNSAPVRLLQLTDTHLFSDESGTMHGVNTEAALEKVLAAVGNPDWSPDGVLATGDLSQDGSPASYKRLRRLVGQLGVPVYCLPGNHDDPAVMQNLLSETPFNYCRTQKLDGWRVPMLDSFLAHRAGGRLQSSTLATLRQDLATSASEHVLICLHHHPIKMHSRWLDTVGLEESGEFLDLVHSSGNVRGVLWGHVHQEFDEIVDGIRFMASPSTCFQFLPRAQDFAIDSRPPGYRWLELHPDGTIETAVRWIDD